MESIPISLRQIAYVLAVADNGGTAAAARTLHVSQPSISLAVAKVEEHFGRALFARNQGQVLTPTPFGRAKLGALRDVQAAARAALTLNEEDAEPLAFGVFSTLGPRYAPALIRSYRRQAPHARINLVEGDLEQLTHWLEAGRIDMALIYDFGLPSSARITPLADVQPYGLVPEDHPLAGRETVSVSDLLADPLILMNLPHSRAFFLMLAEMAGIRPRIAQETASVEMLRALVANGMGVGLLATEIAATQAYDGRELVRLKLIGALPFHRIALARAGSRRTSGQIARFEAHIVAAFEANRHGFPEA